MAKASAIVHRVPRELVDHIFDFLHDDKESLRRCSLVHRNWLPSTSYHLLRSIRWPKCLHAWPSSASSRGLCRAAYPDLNVACSDSCSNSPSLLDLSDMLESSHRLRFYVISLSISGQREGSRQMSRLESFDRHTLAKIFAHLGNLRHLELSRCTLSGISAFWQRDRELESLRIVRVSDEYLPELVWHFRRVSRLDIHANHHGGYLRIQTSSVIPTECKGICFTRCSAESMETAFSALLPGLDVTKIIHLGLPASRVTSSSKLLDAITAMYNITSLSVDTMAGNANIHAGFSHCPLPSLLHLRVNQLYLLTHDSPMLDLATLLEVIRTSASQKTATVHIDMQIACVCQSAMRTPLPCLMLHPDLFQRGLEETDWEGLDSVLLELPALKSIVFEVRPDGRMESEVFERIFEQMKRRVPARIRDGFVYTPMTSSSWRFLDVM